MPTKATASSRNGKATPGWAKPYRDFPLSYHPPSGRLYKKIRGPLEAINTAGLPLGFKNGNALSKLFRVLMDDCGITTKNVGLYTLRHVYRTIADEAKDQPAIDLTMGHAKDDMASHYRERISDERLRALSDHVRQWVFNGEGGR